MTREIHHERTVRLLEYRLETVASATERSLSGPRPLEHQVLAIEAATRHAVRLDVLTPQEAQRIWADVGRRHPGVAWCRSGCSGLAA